MGNNGMDVVNVKSVMDSEVDRQSVALAAGHADADAVAEFCDVRDIIDELIEVAKLARPANDVGWPSALLLVPAHAARLTAVLARIGESP